MTDRSIQNQKAKKARKLHLNEEQLQACYGGLLGDSNLNLKTNGQYRIKFCHSESQLEYLEFKKNILMPFIIQESPTIEQSRIMTINNLSFKSNKFFIYSSIIHQDITNMFPFFYKRKNGKLVRHITMNTMNLIKPLGLLIWFLDDGCRAKDKDLRIYTNAYPLSEQKVFKSWFLKKHKIKALISYNKTNNSYFLRFNVNNSRKLLELFLPFNHLIPKSLRYKVKELDSVLPADCV